ncbi:MAG: hypothetical protein Q9213_002321 [Squamulea squamosa]
MPANERSRIISKLVNTSTFPKSTELNNHTCNICYEDSLTVDGAEIPIKLSCGHIFGMACLVTWMFNQIEADSNLEANRNLSPRCPMCRASLLSRNQTPSDEDDLQFWVQELASWSPGQPQLVNEDWIREAERLWADVCNDLLDTLDRRAHLSAGEPLWGPIETFTCGTGPVTERFLSFGTVYTFYMAYFRLGYRPETNPFFSRLVLFNALITHLRTCEEVDEHWRVFQAFQSPVPQVSEFARRMERSRRMLGERVQKASEGQIS